MRSSRILTLTAIAAALLSTSALARHHTPLPSAHWVPGSTHGWKAPAKTTSGTWTPVTARFPGGSPETSAQMTDGTMLVHDACTSNWYKLTPDNTGNYVNGTWTKMAAMPAGYTPLYFASQVLPDGRLIVQGGEYNQGCANQHTSLGAIYDPVANVWTNVPHPQMNGWSSIGDASSIVLADGTYMLSDSVGTAEALAAFDGNNITWTATGTGKADSNNEEGWTLLPDQTILTVDASIHLGGPNSVEIYSPNTGAWTTQANSTPASCVDVGSHEIGPAPLTQSGLVFQMCGTAATAVYNPASGSWTAGPTLPSNEDSADGPAVTLPDGNVLAQVSPGVFQKPSHFVEFQIKKPNKVKLTQVSEPDSAPVQSSYEGRLMMMPSGQVLWTSDVGDVEIYTPVGKAAKGTAPVVTSVAKTITRGSTNNAIGGTGFNGKTFGGYYGDDAQMATNFPLVRITNVGSGHVCYARTHDHATMGISDGTPTSTQFDVPNSCEAGKSKLEVVANGIPSAAKKVTLN